LDRAPAFIRILLAEDNVKTVDLSGNWRLVRAATRESVPARVPGDTHSALLAAGKIPDPYVGTNEMDVQWVGKEDWWYERELDVSADLLAEDAVHLSCDSLDTMAEVFLNGKKAGSADNMPRPGIRSSTQPRLIREGTNKAGTSPAAPP